MRAARVGCAGCDVGSRPGGGPRRVRARAAGRWRSAGPGCPAARGTGEQRDGPGGGPRRDRPCRAGAGGRPVRGAVADAVPTSSVGAAVGSGRSAAAACSPVGAVADPSVGAPVGPAAEFAGGGGGAEGGAPVGLPGALRSAWPSTTRWASRWKPWTSAVGHQRRRCTLTQHRPRDDPARRAAPAPSSRAAATASCTARLIPTPPTGDIACAASPISSSPSRSQRRSRSSRTSSRRTSSHDRRLVDPVGQPRAAARRTGAAAPRSRPPAARRRCPCGSGRRTASSRRGRSARRSGPG